MAVAQGEAKFHTEPIGLDIAEISSPKSPPGSTAKEKKK
eukprot:CAMPEP_0194762902 /NCGR_PEP_ID=MMETSP0323_2-20130528/17122_1 /TAXON_ID=2866 ORGANISM="Crypthecodinium cohnii, Strain Seligo" /NCGR_SAMPLE_ID=MMETSP0323_2 /ASSEMBLY_ACC=CAM_ASM_000346 /LENGTH=38 /DNA_ID= /DNA_START= /DNA_END= /DNA_ORIENTATION=